MKKDDVQKILKEKYSINQNISNNLTERECQDLLDSLEKDSFVKNLVFSFTDKINNLGKNNRALGTQRSNIEKKYKKLEKENQLLEAQVLELEKKKGNLETKKTKLLSETDEIQNEITTLQQANEKLSIKLQQEKNKSQELANVNKGLKQENRDLKNINDALKLKIAQEMKKLMRLEESEIRKGIIKIVNIIAG